VRSARQAERFAGKPESLLDAAEGAGALRRPEDLLLGQSHGGEDAAEQERSGSEREVKQRDRECDRRGYEAQTGHGTGAGEAPLGGVPKPLSEAVSERVLIDPLSDG
jgi:hypothetical protein